MSHRRQRICGIAAPIGVTLVCLALMATGNSTAYAQVACPEGNLLERARIFDAYDAYHTDRLTDGVIPPEGESWLSDRNALFTTMGYVVYELPQTTRVNSLFVQADSNDSYRVSGSIDGEHWQPLGDVPAVEAPGVRMRYATGFDLDLRYLRIEPGQGDDGFSIGEIAAFCGVPSPWPPAFDVRRGTVRDAAWARGREKRLAAGKIAVGLLGGLLIFVAARSRRCGQPLPVWVERGLLSAVVAFGILAWINFGAFHGPNVVHGHDMFHYALGSKYFAENRYRLLYRCAETAEAEMGRRVFVERRMIRNLSTNELEPATSVLDDPAPCREAFSGPRWNEFKEDVEFFRRNEYPGSWGAIFRDHGYNATPVWTMLAGWITNLDSLSRRPGWLAAIDFTLYLALFVMILWAFGLEVCALAALIWGVGLPWDYSWTGGAFARAPWLSLTVAAVCLFRRSRFGSGGFALACAALLRVFPALFAVGPIMLAMRDAVRSRRIAWPHLRGVVGAAAAVAILVPLSVWSTGGADTWLRFVDNLEKHSNSPLGNHVGLATLYAWDPDNTQAEILTGRLEDFGKWEQGRRDAFAARRAWYVATALGVLAVFVVFVLRCALAEWEAASIGALAVFAVSELASYYLVYFLLFAPFARGQPRRVALLVAAVVLGQSARFADLSVDTLFFVQSLLFLAFSLVLVADLVWDRWRD